MTSSNKVKGFAAGIVAAVCYGTNPLGTLELYGDEEEGLDEDQEVSRSFPAAATILSWCFAVAALVMAGLPPLSGFIAKFAMISAAFDAANAPSAATWISCSWKGSRRPPPRARLWAPLPMQALSSLSRRPATTWPPTSSPRNGDSRSRPYSVARRSTPPFGAALEPPARLRSW